MIVGSLKEGIAKWNGLIGEKEVVRRLTDPSGPDLSVSVAEKLSSGRYSSDLSFDRGQAILREMAKDGIVLTDEAS